VRIELSVPKLEPQELTRLLQSWSGGDKQAFNELAPLVYPELRRLAAGYIRRERRDHTLQPTAVVHEAYLRLAGQQRVEAHCRSQFFAIAANLMRQVLVDHARRHRAAKRGSGNKVSLDLADAAGPSMQLDVIALDEALDRLSHLDPRQSRIVELRFFGGLTEEEVADVLQVSAITVKREWKMAKAVLYNQLCARSAS
jgi:RNA polymerase sigma factor (TIGR02999 family)